MEGAVVGVRGQPLSEEHRTRVSRGLRRYHARKAAERRRRTPLPRDVRMYAEEGVVRPDHAEIVEFHNEEYLGIREAMGEAALTPQREALLRDYHRLGVVSSLVLGVYLRDPSQADLASRLATLATARAKLLGMVGLDRQPRDVRDLRDYIAEKESEGKGGRTD